NTTAASRTPPATRATSASSTSSSTLPANPETTASCTKRPARCSRSPWNSSSRTCHCPENKERRALPPRFARGSIIQAGVIRGDGLLNCRRAIVFVAERGGGEQTAVAQRVLEVGAVEVVLLELLSHAPARQPAVPGATGYVPPVVSQQLDEVVTLDAADKVARQLGERPL